MKNSVWRFAMLILLMLTMLSACWQTKVLPTDLATSEVSFTTEEPPTPTETILQRPLRLGVESSDLGIVDPHFSAGTQERIVVDLVFNGLLRYQPGNTPYLEPDIAEAVPAPRIIDGQQIWRFKLRPEIMCHSGPQTAAYELTADDVVYSFQKAANPARSAYAQEYTGMTFTKVDRYTVDIILDTPLSTILFLPKVVNYSGGLIVCQKAIEAMGDEAFKNHPVGTGPFIFSEHLPHQSVTLTAHDAYFRGPPQLTGVEIVFIPDTSSRLQAFEAGRLDVMRGLRQTSWWEQFKQRSDVIVDIHGVGETNVLHFNTRMKPLDDIRVRQAIVYALNRPKLVDYFGPKIAREIYSPVPEQVLPGGLTNAEVVSLSLDYSFDLERAKSLLAEAGYPDGFNLEVFTSEIETYRNTYQFIKEHLAQIGIEVQLEIVDHPTMHRRIRADENPLIVYLASRPNADIYLTHFFHSDSMVVTGANANTNFSHYNQIDDLIGAARLEIQPTLQTALWKHAQVKILVDLAAYPLLDLNQVYLRKQYVDYGHELINVQSLYPQITEKTRLLAP